MKELSRMYLVPQPGGQAEVMDTWSPGVGCEYNCTFCRKSFQAQMKRRIHDCPLCAQYVPHFHPERLGRVPSGKVVFAFAYCDPRFMRYDDVAATMRVIEARPGQLFLVQSKGPFCFREWEKVGIHIPDNVVLGTTLESNLNWWFPKSYRIDKLTTIDYRLDVSEAPIPIVRALQLSTVEHDRIYDTIEPAFDFELKAFVEMIKATKPEFVYVGYDNHHSMLRDGVTRLPEPPLEKTLALIDELEKFTEVRKKTIRKAWYEESVEGS